MKKLLVFLVLVGVLGYGAYYYRDLILPGNADTLTIVTNTEATDISPYGLNLNNATRIRNIYEGLVTFDSNLKVVPALAISWGNLDDTSWEFRLREGVMFHDGTEMTAQDVVDSFEKAKETSSTQIINYISTIKEVSIGSGNRIVVTTYEPDPLLLSKLTKIFIYKKGDIGTGPYMLDEWVRGEYLNLRAFPEYWGQLPSYPEVRYEVMKSRAERQEAFTKGEIDILVGLTEEQAMDLPEHQVVTNYGLEVNFLMFQLDDPIFEDRSIREAVQTLINPDKIEEIGNHFVRSSNQFIAQGVFGYNQNIPDLVYNPADEARDLFGKRLQPIKLDYLASYGTLVQYLKNKLRQAGFSVKETAVDPNILLEKIGRNESQFFLVGWRAEDGDAGAFYDSFIHSDGSYNNGRYENDEVDELIEESRTEMDPQKRLTMLQEINASISEDLIGIPLFETSRIYGVGEGVVWRPRVDGEVLAIEVSR